jgi:hypothetical protein
MTVVRKLARSKLDLVCVQEVRWEKEGTARAGNYLFLYMEKGRKIIFWGHDLTYIRK